MILVLLGLGGLAGWFGHRLLAPAPAAPDAGEHAGGAPAPGEEPTTWTCSMHPQIKLPKPGQCPICFMDLIPLVASDDEEDERLLTMSAAASKLAEIQTTPVERRFVEYPVRMVGKVTYDERRLRYITAWVAGRLERLFVDYTGVPVARGEHLVSIYSPEVYAAQSSLLGALRTLSEASGSELVQRSTRLSVESARERLALWGLTREQIAAIEASGQPQYTITIHAPISGIVVHKNAVEGMYVQTGTPIYTIADLSRVWVKADAYESDLAWLRIGQEVEVEVDAFPGESFSGRVEFIAPTLDDRTRTTKVRVTMHNEDGRLKPDMFVRATVRARLDDQGRVVANHLAGKWMCSMHPEVIQDEPGRCSVCGMPLVQPATLGYAPASEEPRPPLVVPASAVLATGTRAVVYVKVPDQERPTFTFREVTLGPLAGNQYLITSGLEEGEQVVTRGSFKIDSERQILARPSMMSGDGPAGEEMDGEAGGTQQLPGVPPAVQAGIGAVFTAYLDLHGGLSGDDAQAAARGAQAVEDALDELDVSGLQGEALAVWKHERDSLRQALTSLAGTTALQEQRELFEVAATALETLMGRLGYTGTRDAVKITCPMAFDFRGASWLQASEVVANPYFGESMLRCGTVDGKLPRAGR
jgi:Cu(I)/Ag(I) efflux system membrane fusion protein